MRRSRTSSNAAGLPGVGRSPDQWPRSAVMHPDRRSVRSREPSEEVVERAVLLDQEDHVLDREPRRGRRRLVAGVGRSIRGSRRPVPDRRGGGGTPAREGEHRDDDARQTSAGQRSSGHPPQGTVSAGWIARRTGERYREIRPGWTPTTAIYAPRGRTRSPRHGVLDIGCGHADLLGSSWPTTRVVGIDVDERALAANEVTATGSSRMPNDSVRPASISS